MTIQLVNTSAPFAASPAVLESRNLLGSILDIGVESIISELVITITPVSKLIVALNTIGLMISAISVMTMECSALRLVAISKTADTPRFKKVAEVSPPAVPLLASRAIL